MPKKVAITSSPATLTASHNRVSLTLCVCHDTPTFLADAVLSGSKRLSGRRDVLNISSGRSSLLSSDAMETSRFCLALPPTQPSLRQLRTWYFEGVSPRCPRRSVALDILDTLFSDLSRPPLPHSSSSCVSSVSLLSHTVKGSLSG